MMVMEIMENLFQQQKGGNGMESKKKEKIY